MPKLMVFGGFCRFLSAVVIAASFVASIHTAHAAGMSSIIVDANTGEVLHEQGADAQRFPASITKVMTLYMLFEQLEAGKLTMDTTMEVSEHAASQAPSKLGLRPGQDITVRDAINALAIKSANDVAAIVAEHIGGSEDAFCAMMTRRARSLGMSKTQFVNASGLPDDEQLTTARDLALLGYSIQTRFPELSKAFARHGFTYNGRSMNNHNRLLGRVEGIDGIKTGYTRASGFNLLSSMRVDGRHLIGVVLGGRTSGARDAQMRQLLASNIDDASPRKYALRQFAGRQLVGSMVAANDSDEVLKTPAPRAAVASDKPIQLASNDNTVAMGIAAPKLAPIIVPDKVAVTAPKPSPLKVTSIRGNSEEEDDDEKVSSKNSKKAAPMQWQKGENGKTLKGKEAAPMGKASTPWVVQIAATPDKKSAAALLAKAKSKAPKQLAKATAYTESVKKPGGQLWRARFSNLDKVTAENACTTLKKSAMQCMITRL